MEPIYSAYKLLDREPDKILEHLLALDWMSKTERRREYFMSDVPRYYEYSAFGGMRGYDSSPFTDVVETLRQGLAVLPDRDGKWQPTQFNVCFLNRYDVQHDNLGWHADDSPGMDLDHPIAVMSFGAEREIWWKPKTFKGEIPKEWRRLLQHGSTFIMPAGFQREYFHRIPKCDHACGVRVSLTFRHFIDKE